MCTDMNTEEKHIMKGYPVIVFENWSKQPNSTDRGGKEKNNVVSVASLGSTLRMQNIRLAWTLRAQEQWREDVLRPINR